MVENRIASPKRTIEIINNYSFVFQKKFGQNFLIDQHVLDKIIKSANITKEDVVIEIGPGIGSLTQPLAEKAKKVIAIEIDKNLVQILEENVCEDYENIKVINQDVLKIDLNKLIQEENDGKPVKVVANLPYYITTPIIMKLFEEHIPIELITVMVQKEVAQRMQANPNTKDYGALTLAIRYYAEPYIVAYVPQNCFMPRPQVDSAVIRLTKHEKPPIEINNEKLLFQLIRSSFNQRRKTLIRGLVNQLDYDKEFLVKVFESINIPLKVRGESLTLEQFANLAKEIISQSNI